MTTAHPALSLASRLFVLLLATAATAQCGHVWHPGDGMPGVDQTVFASATWDPDGPGPAPVRLALGGDFEVAGSVLGNRVASFDPVSGQWTALGSGMNGRVIALAGLPNGDLVAAGEFTSAGGVAANYIARWNGSAWAPMGLGMNFSVHALAVLPNGDLVAGGRFSEADGAPAQFVARWNGSAWSNLGAGVSGGFAWPSGVFALAGMANGDVVVGGNFAVAGAMPANNIARWNGATWAAMGSGTDATVLALTSLPNGDVIAGGGFGQAGPINVNRIARWNGTAWAPMALGTGFQVNGLATTATGDVIAVGLQYALRWNGTAWSTLASNILGNVRCVVELPGGDVIAGGSFFGIGSLVVRNVARWNGSAWSFLSTGLEQPVHAVLELPSGDVVIGGQFTTAGGAAADYVARRVSGAWQPLGTGTNGPVYALARLANGDVLAGGSFTSAGGVAANNIARWNGATWSPLGNGITGAAASLLPAVTALLVRPNGDVVAGGSFTTAGGVPAESIASWNGATWSPLGQGLGGSSFFFPTGVNALANLNSGDLAAGGFFPVVGGVTVLNASVATWNGSVWTALPPLTGPALTLAIMPNGDLVAGGGFSSGFLARWTGSGSWSGPGAIAGVVRASQLLPGGDLAIGGTFLTLGGAPATNLARWDGTAFASTAFAALGGGANSLVNALAAASNGDLLVGGAFTAVGGQVSAHYARLTSTCPATASAVGAGCSGSGGANALAATTLPWLGATYTARATGMPANGLALDVLGLTTASTPLGTLLPQGVAGCSLLVSPDLITVDLPAAGVATTTFALPASVALAGVSLHQQVVALEFNAAANLLAATSTNALLLTLGIF